MAVVSGWAGAIAIPELPKLERVSDPLIKAHRRRLQIIVETKDHEKVELAFQPYQGLKLTTVDCFLLEDMPGNLYDRVSVRIIHYFFFFFKLVQVRTSSPWLDQLKAVLRRHDSYATFMDRALHFTFVANDDWVEVAAWQVEFRVGNGPLQRYPSSASSW